MSDSITIKKPFDSHVHFRQGSMLRAVVPESTRMFCGALVMPNTEPPIETTEQAATYKKEILAALPENTKFEPLMSFYLTKNLTPAEIEKGFSGEGATKVHAVKSYPFGATTNSEWGLRSVLEAKDVLKKMEGVGMPLLLHGEVHVDDDGKEVDPYEGEHAFIEDTLPRLLETYPKLKISLEHLSTAVAADFIEKNGAEGRLVATITPHHLMYSREDAESDALLACRPLIKSSDDRDAVRALAAKGLPFVSAGTDSAPHSESAKRGASPAFGVFTAPVAVEFYTQIFEELGCLDTLENFLSINGPKFFGIEPSRETITLEKKDWQFNELVITEEGERITPMTGTVTIHWHAA